MRIRSIKPEYWRSDDIAALPISTRLTFIGLWSYVDDNGVGADKLVSIVADLYADDFSNDPQETLQRVSADMQRLASGGQVTRYRAEHNGSMKDLVYVTKWSAHQKIQHPSLGHKYPLPPADLIKASERLTNVSGESHEGLQHEQGNRGTGEQEQGAEEQGERASAQRAQPNFGEILRGTPDPPPEPPPIDVEAEPVSPSNHRRTAELLVRDHIPNHHPKATLTELRNQTNALLLDGQPEDVVADALRLWTQKKLHPKTLPSLCSEVINGRASPTNVTAFQRKTAHNAAVFQALADHPNNPELLA